MDTKNFIGKQSRRNEIFEKNLFMGILIFSLILGVSELINAEVQIMPNGFCGWSTNASCTSDAECHTGGCSGQVCSGINENITTTCEWLECYDHTKYNVTCGCFNNVCQWHEISIQTQEECTCNSCDDCKTKLNNNSCKVVKLTLNIINQTGNCIDNPANFTNKIFDCQGHVIDGDLTEETVETYGIYLLDKQNNTIKNCIITNFEDGIYIAFSSNISLMNNTIRSNWNGIYIFGNANNNLILNNTISNNGLTGISIADFYGSSDVKSCINETQGTSTGTNNSANASNNQIYETNPSEIGAKVTACIKDGKVVACTKNATNETKMCEKVPAKSIGNTNNTIKDNRILDNGIGIYSNASNSTINANVLNNKIYDLYSDNWGSSLGDNNTCIKTNGWNDSNTEGCKILFISKEFDYDNNGIIDTFDAVTELVYLSEGKGIYYNGSKIGGNELLLKIFALIEKIVME